MFYRTFLMLLAAAFFSCTPRRSPQLISRPVEMVNPLMGTQSDFSLSTGNTYPAIARPWGMNFWAPQTGTMGDGWMFT